MANRRKFVSDFVQETLGEMYPERSRPGLHHPLHGQILDEVRFSDVYSEVGPLDPDISTKIGNINLAVPFIPAPMDTVTGPEMAKVMHELGTFGPLFRHPESNVQLEWLEEVLGYSACLVKHPKSLNPDQQLYKAHDILKKEGFSTIPITSEEGTLLGVLFTGDIAFTEMKDRYEEPVRKWMRPVDKLKLESVDTPFSKIRNRLLDEEMCSMLPIIDKNGRLQGIYFMKDLIFAKPSIHKDKPLVGIAVSDHLEDLERVRIALEMGAGVVVIDSSHGNCKKVIDQTKRISELKDELKKEFVLISGNIGNMDGYYRLALAGADGIKCGIGSGSICTTSSGTGVGVPMYTAIQQISFLRNKMRASNLPAPAIIPDGGVGNPGNLKIALIGGGDLCMSGEWFVAAKESISADNGRGVIQIGDKLYVRYRGMASDGAIKDRSSIRYGRGKTAAEGIEGLVPYRGELKKWIRSDLELIKGGFAHTGSENIQQLHEFGQWPFATYQFSSFGKSQLDTRITKL